jgi:hypothetical protein
MEKMLIELSFKPDVRDYLSERLKIASLLTVDEREFLTLEEYTSNNRS